MEARKTRGRRALRDGRRPRPLQRLRRVRGGLRGREQRAARGRARDRAQRHHLDARPARIEAPGDAPRRVRPDDVPAVRRQDALRVGLPAERGRGGPRPRASSRRSRCAASAAATAWPRARTTRAPSTGGTPSGRAGSPRRSTPRSRRARAASSRSATSAATGSRRAPGRAGRGRRRREDPPDVHAGLRRGLPGRGDRRSATWTTRRARSPASRRRPSAFRLLERLGTGAKVYYRTERDWVRRLADGRTAAGDGRTHG